MVDVIIIFSKFSFEIRLHILLILFFKLKCILFESIVSCSIQHKKTLIYSDIKPFSGRKQSTEHELNTKYINIIQNLYSNMTCYFRLMKGRQKLPKGHSHIT